MRKFVEPDVADNPPVSYTHLTVRDLVPVDRRRLRFGNNIANSSVHFLYGIRCGTGNNGAFSPADAMEKLKRLSELELHSIEQPIRAGQWRSNCPANCPPAESF